uniref:Uncharacterized protein n=1 Tax=Romanomermis culicivorax TaxID=13658 RepID=A0A915HUM8_ROMCU
MPQERLPQKSSTIWLAIERSPTRLANLASHMVGMGPQDLIVQTKNIEEAGRSTKKLPSSTRKSFVQSNNYTRQFYYEIIYVLN